MNDIKEDLLISKNIRNSIIDKEFEGGNQCCIIAGPCAVENKEQIEEIAKYLKKINLTFLRGGIFKPRTSPYSFQGLGLEGLKFFREIADKYKMKIVSEVMSLKQLEEGYDYIDIIQVGSRNMQNFELLKELGKLKKPVILKRGFMATVKEFLLAAEYIVSGGNYDVILCERGIRTFENSTRNTLDISAIPIIKNTTTLPVIVDISHSLGRKDIAIPIARSVIAAGVDGIMVEVHNKPTLALSDEKQQLDLIEFNQLFESIKGLSNSLD